MNGPSQVGPGHGAETLIQILRGNDWKRSHSLCLPQEPDVARPALLIGRALERGQQVVTSALLAHLNVVTLPEHTAEVDGPLLSRVQQINAQVPASMRWELFAHHLISATQTG